VSTTPSKPKVTTPTTPPRTRRTGVLRRLTIWLLLLATWEASYRLIGWRPWLFPAPSHVLDAIVDLIGFVPHTRFGDAISRGWPLAISRPLPSESAASPLLQAILVSAFRLGIGFAFTVIAGALFGVLLWSSRAIDDVLGPLFLGLQTLPSVCWIPLAILLPGLGIGERGVLFVLVMGSVFGIATSFRDGLRTIPPAYRSAGQMLGARGWRLAWFVLLPASLPALASSLRLGFSFAWRSLMGAELIFAVQRHGLGFLLSAGREFGDVAQVVAVMAVMVWLSVQVDRLAFARLESAVARRFGLSRA
jgi:NitT/TauT family transport system permease protein